MNGLKECEKSYLSLLELWRNYEPCLPEHIPSAEIPNQPGVTFESKLIAAVESALDEFGNGMPAIVHYNMSWLAGLRYEEIPFRPAEFQSCLDKIFRSSSKSVRKAISDEVCRIFGIHESFDDLASCFAAARSKGTP